VYISSSLLFRIIIDNKGILLFRTISNKIVSN
jgi:hypothetical protein